MLQVILILQERLDKMELHLVLVNGLHLVVIFIIILVMLALVLQALLQSSMLKVEEMKHYV